MQKFKDIIAKDKPTFKKVYSFLDVEYKNIENIPESVEVGPLQAPD